MASNHQTTGNGTSHADLLARISALELENKLLRESIEKQQQSAEAAQDSKIYFDGYRTRLDTDDNAPTDDVAPVDTSDRSMWSSTRNMSDGTVCFPLDECNRFSARMDINDESFVELDELDDDNRRDKIKNLTQSLTALEQPSSSSLQHFGEKQAPLLGRELERHSELDRFKSDTISRAVELQRTLTVLNTMLARKTIRSFDSSLETNMHCFKEFYLLSVNLGADRSQSDWVDSGSTFLDPLVLKSANCLDQYPVHLKRGMSTDELSMFCLSGGLKIRSVPKVAKKSDWEDAVDYKVLVVSRIQVLTYF